MLKKYQAEAVVVNSLTMRIDGCSPLSPGSVSCSSDQHKGHLFIRVALLLPTTRALPVLLLLAWLTKLPSSGIATRSTA